MVSMPLYHHHHYFLFLSVYHHFLLFKKTFPKNLYLNGTLSSIAAGTCWYSRRVAFWFLISLVRIPSFPDLFLYYFVFLWKHSFSMFCKLVVSDNYSNAQLSYLCNHCKACHCATQKASKVGCLCLLIFWCQRITGKRATNVIVTIWWILIL